MFSVAEAHSWAREQEAERIVGAAIPVGRPVESMGQPAPEEWRPWLEKLFPQYTVDHEAVRDANEPFAAHHQDYWERVWEIEADSAPQPIVPVWARGGAKSTSTELGTVALGVRGKRRYALYVCGTQDSADKHVASIGSMLESRAVEDHYPAHANKAVNKHGHSKGWRRNRLVTAGGFLVDAIGLDTAMRGIKFEEQRPDLIVLDDIDEETDGPHITAKKIKVLTKAILPAGSTNVAVIALQNLILQDGVFTRLVDGRADFLAERTVLGPVPAIEGLETEYRRDEKTGTQKAVIVAGTPTWEGQSLEVCQHLMDTIGLSAFLTECQHEVFDRAEGLALRYTERHLEDLTDDECRKLVRMGQTFAGIDFGEWRFAFVLRAVDPDGVVHQIDELFSQREDLTVRARKIDDLLRDKYHVPVHGFRIYGDSANPQDIREINKGFQRVAQEKEEALRAEAAGKDAATLRVVPYRVVPTARKIRLTAVDRLNDLLDRRALRYRRGAMQGETWRHGYNTGSGGTVMEGSRLQWEVRHWSYPVPKEGEAQKQDPDDHTADGADAIAADRYGIMSWWKAAHSEEPEEKPDRNTDTELENVMEQLEEAHRDADPQRTGTIKRKRGALKRRQRT